MDSNAYKIRDEARARVSKAELPKDESCTYMHDDVILFLQRINRKLEQQLNKYTSSGKKHLVLDCE